MKAILKQFSKPFFRWVGKLPQAVGDSRQEFPIAYWYEPNLCEPSVQLAMRDLVRGGDTVFDVGANCGSLSLMLSRLVGPRGIVCSFEASRRIVDKTQYNLVNNGCGNVTLYHRAVFHTSGNVLPIYYGSHLNDSVMAANDFGYGVDHVETISLDDFSRIMKVTPSLIKIDIEGAEFDALQGAKDLISRARPHLLLEQQTNDSRCFDFLQSRGYLAIDLSTYHVIEKYQDFPAGVALTNIAYLHKDRLTESDYPSPCKSTKVAELGRDKFHANQAGELNLVERLPLVAGRYVFHFDNSADGTKNEVMIGVESESRPIARYHAYSKLLADNYQWMPLHLSKKTNVNIYHRFLKQSSDPTFVLQKVSIYRVEGFSDTWNDVI